MKIGSCGFYRYRQSVCAALKTFAGSEGPVFDSSVSALGVSITTKSITTISIAPDGISWSAISSACSPVIGLRNKQLIDVYARFPSMYAKDSEAEKESGIFPYMMRTMEIRNWKQNLWHPIIHQEFITSDRAKSYISKLSVCSLRILPF